MGIRKRKEKTPEPAPVQVPSRGTLLNKWAARQDKLQKLVEQVGDIKTELINIAQLLHTHYGVLVTDTTHSVTMPKTAAPVVSGDAKPSAIDPAPDDAKPIPAGTTPGEDGKPVKLLPPEQNPLAKSPMPVVGEPSTGPMTERDVENIREDSKLERGGNPQEMAQNVVTTMDRIIRQGLGK